MVAVLIVGNLPKKYIYKAYLPTTNNFARSLKKNARYIEKRLKQNEKTGVKYKKKRIQLEQKLKNNG